MTRNSRRLIITAAVVAFAIVGFAVVLPAFIRARTTSASNACVNNLRQIDAAKQQWMLENGKTTNDIPSWDAIRPYLGRGPEGEVPRCPQGGTYILGRAGEPPRCSIGGSGHSL